MEGCVDPTWEILIMCRFHSRGRVVVVSGLFAALATLSAPNSAAEPGDITAFRNVRVFDGTRVLPSATVVVKGGIIEQVGPGVEAPKGARIVDGTGKTLVPGLIDCHVHILEESQLRQAAVFGVTTVLDMGSDPVFAARIREQQSSGE